MKKMCFIIAILTVLLLSGCGQKPDSNLPAEEQKTPGTGVSAAGDRSPTAEELGRAEKTDLEFVVEGETEAVPAKLYIGQGYSMYIPVEGWRLDKDMDDGVPEETWESTVNGDVKLRVLHLGQRSLEEAQTLVEREEDDYRFQEDKQGGLLGTDQEDRELMEVRFYPAGGMMYAVLYTYPEEAVEGFGARLSVMADTFEVIE